MPRGSVRCARDRVAVHADSQPVSPGPRCTQPRRPKPLLGLRCPQPPPSATAPLSPRPSVEPKRRPPLAPRDTLQGGASRAHRTPRGPKAGRRRWSTLWWRETGTGAGTGTGGGSLTRGQQPFRVLKYMSPLRVSPSPAHLSRPGRVTRVRCRVVMWCQHSGPIRTRGGIWI